MHERIRKAHEREGLERARLSQALPRAPALRPPRLSERPQTVRHHHRTTGAHVSFGSTSVDRIGGLGYVPGLQYEGGWRSSPEQGALPLNRGFSIPSAPGRRGRPAPADVSLNPRPGVRPGAEACGGISRNVLRSGANLAETH